MIVVPEPGADLVEPRALAGRRRAQGSLEDRVHEDAIDPRVGDGELEQPHLARTPGAGGASAARVDHHLLDRLAAPRADAVPDVDVEAGLVARVAVGRRPAARLREVAEGDR